MATNILTRDGAGIAVYRTFTPNASLSATTRLPPTQTQLGMNNSDATMADTSLSLPILIQNGTVCDNGSNTLTGTAGGSNSTSNTSTYKQGSGQTDYTAQNLITTGVNATKQWYKTGLTANVVTTKPYSCWLYIKDAATLAKFLASGTCLQLRFGSDASNYYAQSFTLSTLAQGWNYITSNRVNVGTAGTFTTVGTPGTLSRFDIVITTADPNYQFVAGDVIYDLLRQWTPSDLIQSFVNGYPTFDYTISQATIRTVVNATQGNGFPTNAHAYLNEDTSPLMFGVATFPEESKSEADEFIFVNKYRFIL